MRATTLPAFVLAVALLASLDLSAGQSDFDAQWQIAENLRGKASLARYEWRDTEKILKNSRKEYVAGNKVGAFNLLAQSIAQSNAALAQARREEEGWKRRVIR